MTKPASGGGGARGDNDWRLGIDVGGTFTDFVLVDARSGQVIVHKVPSLSAQRAFSIDEGLLEIVAKFGVTLAEVSLAGHGSTVATNTLLERKGVRVGMIVTDGFGDILTIGRVAMPQVGDLQGEKVAPLVPDGMVRTVHERVGADGRVLVPLQPDEVRIAAAALVHEGAESVAICFMHADRHPSHEQAAKLAITASMPDLPVWISSDVWPEIREYERAVLTTINAYVGPPVREYYAAIVDTLAQHGVANLLIAQANGGMASPEVASTRPAFTLQSGPAAGVAAASHVGGLVGRNRLIALDIGGTSTDLAVIDRSLPYTSEGQVGDFAVMIPMVDVSSIGAGGGSIAWVDRTGSLQVGPASAGATPGPVCYGRGGAEFTLTDAYLLTGMLASGNFRGGGTTLDIEAARRIASRIGQQVGLQAEEVASAVIEISTAKMYAEVARVAGKRGIDVREYSIIAYGGAGPTHAALLARELGAKEVIIPQHPGVLCAMGCVTSDIRADFARTAYVPLSDGSISAAWRRILLASRALESDAEQWLARQGISIPHRIQHEADARYEGQSFSLAVPFDIRGTAADLVSSFHGAHESAYAHADRNASVEVVSVRVRLIAPVSKPKISRRRTNARSHAKLAERAPSLERRRAGGAVERDALRSGDTIRGPTVVGQYDTTTFIPNGFTARVDEIGNLIVTPEPVR